MGGLAKKKQVCLGGNESMATDIQDAKEESVAGPKRALPPGVAKAHAVATRMERRLATLIVLTPLVGTCIAIAFLWLAPFGVTELALLFGMFTLTSFGIGSGYHRLSSHRSFQTYSALRVFLVILGSMAGQGPVLYWAAIHRRHHKFSDGPGDPHSPRLSGSGLWGTLKGFWHVYLGWVFTYESTDWAYWIPDLLRDRTLFRVNRLYFLWLFLGLAIPAGIGGLVSGTWMGALLGLLWGGLVRMFLGHIAIVAVNSVTHLWGAQPYKSHDYSRNNGLVALLSYGEGWHNNHHAFPSSAMHGLEWWQLDFNGLLIRALRLCGLAWDVKCPSRSARQEARREPGKETTAEAQMLGGSSSPTHEI
jgi:stearoyl-CoA desaturase (delta-9 desaturase)